MTSAVHALRTDTDPAPGAEPEAAADADGRFARLRVAARRLAAGARGLDVATVLLYVGVVSVPLGLVLIVLGYWGAAHAAREIEQTPYLISGGLLGLALVVGGGFAYFGYWQTRAITQGDELREVLVAQNRLLERRLSAIEQAFQDIDAGPLDAGPMDVGPLDVRPLDVRPPAAGAARPSANGVLLATPEGSLAHRSDCPVVAERTDTRAVPADGAFGRCKICRPPVDAPRP